MRLEEVHILNNGDLCSLAFVQFKFYAPEASALFFSWVFFFPYVLTSFLLSVTSSSQQDLRLVQLAKGRTYTYSSASRTNNFKVFHSTGTYSITH